MARDIPQAIRENRSRRAAARQGWRLVKIRRRDPWAIGYGKWYVTENNAVIFGDPDYGADLDDVERFLRHETEAGGQG